MFEMGFLPDIRRIVKQLPAKRQALMFSATMAEDIRKLTQEALKDFDYQKVAPARDTEFARPPREPRGRRPEPRTEKAAPRTPARAPARTTTRTATRTRRDLSHFPSWTAAARRTGA